MNLIYRVAKSLIEKKTCDKEKMKENLGVFLMFNQITKEEYTELMDMLVE